VLDAEEVAARLELLEELQERVGSIDNGGDLHTIGGLVPLINTAALSPHAALRAAAAEVLATTVQNHPKAQGCALDNGALAPLLKMAAGEGADLPPSDAPSDGGGDGGDGGGGSGGGSGGGGEGLEGDREDDDKTQTKTKQTGRGGAEGTEGTTPADEEEEGEGDGKASPPPSSAAMVQCRVKALLGLSCLLRGCDKAQEAFQLGQGFALLRDCLRVDHPKVRVRVLCAPGRRKAKINHREEIKPQPPVRSYRFLFV
jgi:hsp70-interacting protein